MKHYRQLSLKERYQIDAASFVMTRAMGGNAALAANIVVLSTAGSLLTVTGGLIALKYLGLV